jgi:hypothetical protein
MVTESKGSTKLMAGTGLRTVFVISVLVMLVVLAWGSLSFFSYGPIRTPLAVVGLVFALIVMFGAGPWLDDSSLALPRLGIWWIRIGGALAVALVALVATGATVRYIGPGTEPPPKDIRDPLTQAPEVLAYAQRLIYDSSHHAQDEQWLEVKPSRGAPLDSILGPRARISPERNSFRNGRSALVGIGAGKGRIVARIWVDPGYRNGAGHPKLRLPPGTSYLWLDSLPSSGYGVPMRALIFPEGGGPPVRIPNAVYGLYKRMWASYPQGRWQYDPNDPCMCESCVSHGWCQVCGDFF